MVYSNFFLTQLVSTFVHQKELYYIHDNTDVNFFSSSSSVKFQYFSRASFRSPFCFFDNIYLSFLHIEKKLTLLYELYKLYNSFFYTRLVSRSELSLSELSEETTIFTSSKTRVNQNY